MSRKTIIFTIIWTALTAGAVWYFKPEYLSWAIIFPLIFASFLLLKWKLLQGKFGKELSNPVLYLSVQGAFFLLALILIAVVMLAFKESKKILLPLLLINYLVYLAFDLYAMLKEKPLK